MGTQQRDSLSDSENNTRKRVCKACDRCRLKKSKCDGSSPCNRCKTDNTICVFGERKKSHDKVYPKGYVEMLEQQQEKLVNGIRELYARAISSGSWTGAPLQNTPKGYPLTHDILERLGFLRLSPHDEIVPFEENTDILRQRMMIKQEENPYPTPISTKSEFSPVESPRYDMFSASSSFADVHAPPTPFQATTPLQSPVEQASIPYLDGLGIDTSMGMDTSSIRPRQSWSMSGSSYELANAGYFLAPDCLQGLDRTNPCLPMGWPEDELCNIGNETLA